MGKSSTSKSPPRLVFRVGIIGHRPNRLPGDQAVIDLLGRTLSSTLATIQSATSRFASEDQDKPVPFYSTEPETLRAVSSLAEGVDLLFADAAIKLEYELLCPMPFSQEEFERDFLAPNATEKDSRSRFHTLLQRAREGGGLKICELGGSRSDPDHAYGEAGRFVVKQSDLIVAVWDRGKAAGGGGTVQTLHEAVSLGVPVLWINPFWPAQWRLLRTEADIKGLESETPLDTGAVKDVPTDAAPMDPSMAAEIEAIVIGELVRPRRVRSGQE